MNDQELRTKLGEILVKWNMPTRQVAIGEILELFEQAVEEARLDECKLWKSVAGRQGITSVESFDERIAQLSTNSRKTVGHEHIHSYTVPVEFRYQIFRPISKGYKWLDVSVDRAERRVVTKLRCSTCDSEVERKV